MYVLQTKLGGYIMNNGEYEKVATGRSLNDIFGKIEKLNIVESYLIHVETVDGAENNFISAFWPAELTAWRSLQSAGNAHWAVSRASASLRREYCCR
jgi:hypothetical protein